MLFKKPVLMPLIFSLVLSACGSGNFGIGNGGANTSGTETETETETETGTDTGASVSLALGSGSGSSFVSGAMTTTTDGMVLSYGGDTAVSVNIVKASDNSLYSDSTVIVSFTSNCVVLGTATIDATRNSSTGSVTASYSASSCEGTDVITATLGDGTSATATVNIAAQELGSLEFVTATPSTIALKGSGSSSNPEVSEVSFKLLDSTNAPMQGKTVNYTLSTEIGGISLSSSSSVTQADGTTSVTLSAGGVNASVSVTASVTDDDGNTITTASNPIAIVGGIPDQNSFSLSVSTLNPRGWNYDGSTSTITIRAADRFNNPAPDGTGVSFVTYGGAIVGYCAMSGGACSVNWTSQNPRSVNYGDGADDIDCDSEDPFFSDVRLRKSAANPGYGDACGLVKILARTTGEESFQDVNSDGKFDIGETITTPLGEAYNDENNDGEYTSGEFYSDFNNNDQYDTKTDTYFQGASCSAAALAAGHCANLVEVREETTLCMSTDDTMMYDDHPNNVFSGANQVTLNGNERDLVFQFVDYHGLSPASGTTVSAKGDNVEVVFSALSVPNECSIGGYYGFVTIGPSGETDDDDDATTGSLSITVTQPNAISKTWRYTILD